MTNDQTAKMLERVRALLAKAEATEFPGEAEVFRAKADELMTRHAIDQWMVEQAQDRVGERQEPVRRDFDRSWRGSKFRWDLWDIFQAVAEHCRCVVGTRGQTFDLMPVYGLPSDLDYLDMLYTSLTLEVAKNLQPPVDPAGEVGHEVYKQRQAGIGWTEITRKMYAAELVDLTPANRNKYLIPEGERLDWETLRSVVSPGYGGTYRTSSFRRGDLGDLAMDIKNRLANANRRYVKENGLSAERNYVKPEVYQRSFMMGFTYEIEDRLREMRRATRATATSNGTADSMALAVRDIRSRSMSLYEEAYPPPPPVPVDPNAKPTRAPAVREVAVDYGAMGAGRRKARSADLMNPAGRRIKNRDQIG